MTMNSYERGLRRLLDPKFKEMGISEYNIARPLAQFFIGNINGEFPKPETYKDKYQFTGKIDENLGIRLPTSDELAILHLDGKGAYQRMAGFKGGVSSYHYFTVSATEAFIPEMIASLAKPDSGIKADMIVDGEIKRGMPLTQEQVIIRESIREQVRILREFNTPAGNQYAEMLQSYMFDPAKLTKLRDAIVDQAIDKKRIVELDYQFKSYPFFTTDSHRVTQMAAFKAYEQEKNKVPGQPTQMDLTLQDFSRKFGIEKISQKEFHDALTVLGTDKPNDAKQAMTVTLDGKKVTMTEGQLSVLIGAVMGKEMATFPMEQVLAKYDIPNKSALNPLPAPTEAALGNLRVALAPTQIDKAGISSLGGPRQQ